VNGNRGTSGIDGTVSTTVGAAMAAGALTTLIVGDLDVIGSSLSALGLGEPVVLSAAV
jgi:2-succinyl-5-enolpyruvyl-6-hydroxy-3-cyclohexene-1-carboxylate synthase